MSDKLERPKIPDWQKDCKYIHLKDLDSFEGIPQERQVVVVDFETTGLDRKHDKVVGMSFCFKSKEAYYISVRHPDTENVTEEELLSFLQKHFTDKTIIYWNARFDNAFMTRLGFKLAFKFKDKKVRDAAIYAYVLDPALAKRLKGRLKTFAKACLGLEMIEIRQVLGLSKRRKKGEPEYINFGTIPVDKTTLAYACADADCTFRLLSKFLKCGGSDKKYQTILEIDHNVLEGVEYIENCGIKIDIDRLIGLKDNLEAECNDIHDRIMTKFDTNFNLASSDQLGSFLYKDLKLKVEKKTPGGKPSTDKEAIAKLLSKHKKKYPMLGEISRWKKLRKKLDSYIDLILNGLDPSDGNLHPCYHTSQIVTGRFSGRGDGKYLKSFNVQSVPKELDFFIEDRIRNCFVVDEGWTWVSIDWSQVELRIIAHYSQDPALLYAYQNGLDIHEETARKIFNIPEGQPVTKEQRDTAKTLNFNSAYTFYVYEISRLLGISEDDAWDYFNTMFDEAYPVWGQYKNRLRNKSRRMKKATTWFGRIIPLESYKYKITKGDREGLNYPIQGTGADMMRLAVYRCFEYIKRNNIFSEIKMGPVIHDELNFFIKGLPGQERFDRFVGDLKQVMEIQPPKFTVPIVADVTVGPSWCEQYKWTPGQSIGNLKPDFDIELKRAA